MTLIDRDEARMSIVRSPMAAYLMVFSFVGISLSIAGPSLGHLRARAGVGIGTSGLIMGGQALGYIVGSLIAGRFYDRGHGHQVLVRAGAVGLVAVGALSVLHQFWLLVAVFVVIGIAGSMVDVGGNTLVVWSQPPGRIGSSLNALHLCFGLGALATPLVVALSIEATGSLSLMAVLIAIVMAAVVWRLRGTTVPTRREAAHHELDSSGSVRALTLVCVFFFVYVGAEITFAGWLFTYGEEIGLGDAGSASVLVSVFWGGFVVGRVIAVWLATRVASSTMLVASCALATLSAIVLGLGDGSSRMVWTMTALTGVFLGPQFATMMAFGDERLRLSGASTARFVAAAGLGGLVLPVASGWLLDRRGVSALPWTVAVASAASLAMALTVVRSATASPQRPPVTSMNAPVT